MPTASGVADRRLPLRLLTFAIVVTAVVLAWLGWTGYQSHLRDQEQRKYTERTEQLRWTLRSLNERLVLVVRAATATGDPSWVQQFDLDQRRRRHVLEAALNLPAASTEKQALRERVLATYKRHVATQQKLFEHLAEGRASEAQDMLASNAYLEQRAEFFEALASYFGWLQAADGAYPRRREPVALQYAAGAASLLFLLAGWGVVVVNMRRWQAALVDANDSLARQKAELEELNASLDQRVAHRTRELEASQVALARQAEELERANADLTTEIEHHRQTAAALDREQYLLHALMDNLPDNVYFKDCEGRFLRINKAKAARSGLQSPDEALNKTDFDFFPAEHARRAQADEQALIASGEPLVGKEEQLVWPDGAVTWASTTKTPYRDQDGKIIGTLGVSRDITAQKRVEQKLRENAQRMQLILDTAREAFVGINLQGRIIEWNAQAEAILGWKREEALGQPVAELIVPPQHRAAHVAGLLRFQKTGEGAVLNQRIEITALHRSGVEFPIELSVTPLNLNGEWSFYAFLHDITARKRHEEELQRAKEAAEAASRAKSDFLANMSHEIRTPMNAIIGMTDLVLDSELSETQREYLKMVQTSGESLLTIINDILDYSKIEAGKLELASAPFSLRQCVGDTLKSLALRAHGKNLELAWRVVEPAPDRLVGDADRLRQVIVNLVGNAIKFTDQGEVVLEVACSEQSPEEAELHFQVRDTGVGVAPDKLKIIFEAFEQADTSSTRRYGGTGLGLTIASRLVELMGGNIWVESELGHGSEFHFTTRFRCSDDASADPSPQVGRSLSEVRALAVDDNATNRLIVTEMLRHWRITTVAASDAVEALHLLQTAHAAGEPFHLVVTDYNMPDHDGFELIEWIRDDPRLRDTAVIMLTSTERLGDIARCRRLGVARRLTKPAKHSELFEAILDALNVEREETDAPRPADLPAADPAAPLQVLLVEDSLFNQKLAIGLLEKQGHHVTVADNGQDALRLLGEGKFDVVLMDVRMPEMDGLAATAAIRDGEKGTGAHLPIIAMTAHAMTGDREKCLAAGMDGYLAKPVRAAELYEALQTALRHAPPPTGANHEPHPAAESHSEPESPAATGDDEGVRFAGPLEAIQDDHELVADVIDLFLTECPRRVERLREAILARDGDQLRLAAHTLKGELRNFTAGRASDLAFNLERRGCESSFDGAEQVLGDLQQELDRLRPQLAGFLRRDVSLNGRKST